MRQSEVLDIYRPTEGYHASDRASVPPNALADGSFNVFVQAGSTRIFRGLKPAGVGGRTMFQVVDGYAALVDEFDESESESEQAVEGTGSIFNFIARSLFFIGNGLVYYNGVLLEDGSDPFVATSNLQLSPYPYEEPFVAGLAQPDAPLVDARTPSELEAFTGLLTGLYSFKIARVRSLTGAPSNASVTSAVILFSGQTARLTFPEASENGQDRWAIFATKAGFGGTGVHYLVMEIDDDDLSTIDGVERSYQIEFNDSDLLPITAYIDNYPPPAGSYAGRLENYVAIIGAYDNAIAMSIRNFPESYHPEHLGFLPKRPTAILQDQMGSYMYVATETSVHAISVAPSAFGNPLIMQTVWTDTGIENSHNWCSVEGAIFAMVSRQGAVTMDAMGRPNNEFAKPVANKMKDWEVANVRVLHAPDLNSVLYCHAAEVYAFNYQELKWSSPAMCEDFAEGEIVSGVVDGRRLKICLLDGEDFDLYEFDEQSDESESEGAVTNFKIVSPDRKLNPAGRINIYGIKATFQAPEAETYTIKAVTDYEGEEKTLTFSAEGEGMQETHLTRWAMLRKNAVRVEFEGSQSDFDEECFLAGVAIFGTHEMSNRLVPSSEL